MIIEVTYRKNQKFCKTKRFLKQKRIFDDNAFSRKYFLMKGLNIPISMPLLHMHYRSIIFTVKRFFIKIIKFIILI